MSSLCEAGFGVVATIVVEQEMVGGWGGLVCLRFEKLLSAHVPEVSNNADRKVQRKIFFFQFM